MKFIHRILPIVLVLMLLSLSACTRGGSENDDADVGWSSSEPAEADESELMSVMDIIAVVVTFILVVAFVIFVMWLIQGASKGVDDLQASLAPE